MKNNVHQKIDIAVLQEQMRELHRDVKEILITHIPLLREQIQKVRIDMAYYLGGLAVVGFILQLVIRIFYH